MPPNPACQSFVPSLSPYIDGELKPSERQTVERHLAVCKDCTMRVADLRAESALLRVGLDMAADEVDFKDFAQKVMARVTPEKPPLGERLKLWLQETFQYQRGMMLTSAVTAAVVLVVAVPVIWRAGPPQGYAGERMVVEKVTRDPGAQVAPVVYETDTGDAIIWMVDEPSAKPSPQGPGDEADTEELGIEKSKQPGEKGEQRPESQGEPPTGGEL